MTAKLTADTAIAVRTLHLADRPDETVEIFIGKPFAKSEDEWHCPYRILGGGEDLNFAIIGVDAVQALQLVFTALDGTLGGTDWKLFWDGEPFAGFTRKG